MTKTFEEWKADIYGENYSHGYDSYGACDGTCDGCLYNDYVGYLEDQECAINETIYMNERDLALDEFHNTVTPEWDEEQIVAWMEKSLNAAQVNALKDYFFELYSLAESTFYKLDGK